MENTDNCSVIVNRTGTFCSDIEKLSGLASWKPFTCAALWPSPQVARRGNGCRRCTKTDTSCREILSLSVGGQSASCKLNTKFKLAARRLLLDALSGWLHLVETTRYTSDCCAWPHMCRWSTFVETNGNQAIRQTGQWFTSA